MTALLWFEMANSPLRIQNPPEGGLGLLREGFAGRKESGGEQAGCATRQHPPLTLGNLWQEGDPMYRNGNTVCQLPFLSCQGK